MRNFSILIIIICLLIFASGCWDKQELEDNTFAVLLGLDTSGDKNVTVTIAYPVTQLDQDEMEYTVMSATASSLTEGLNMLGAKLAGPLALHSVKTVVISQELAESDAMTGRLFSPLRQKQVRNTTNLLISACTAQEFINARVENLAIDLLRQEELLLEQANKSAYYKPLQLLDFIINLQSDGADSVIMLGNIVVSEEKAEDDKEDKKDEDKDEKSEKEDAEENNGEKEDKSEQDKTETSVKKGYLPGDMPVKADNNTQICGLAVFRRDKMVGVLDSAESQTFSMLTSNKLQKTLTLPDPYEPDKSITVSVQRGFGKINSRIDGERPIFDIVVDLRCAVEYAPDGFDTEIAGEYIKEACAADALALIEKVQKEYNADVLKLGNKLRFKSAEEQRAFNWREKYADAEINVIINVKMIQNSPHKSL